MYVELRKSKNAIENALSFKLTYGVTAVLMFLVLQIIRTFGPPDIFYLKLSLNFLLPFDILCSIRQKKPLRKETAWQLIVSPFS